MIPNQKSIERLITQWTGTPSRIVSATPASGGCINEAVTIELSSGERFFVKQNRSAPDHFFAAEASGLEAIRQTGTVRVPQVIGWIDRDRSAEPSEPFACLVLEYIATGKPGKSFFAKLGQQLAALHRALSPTEQFGWEEDNYLGRTDQPNAWHDDWIGFWSENRIGHQLELAARSGVGGKPLQRLGRKFLERLPERLAGDPVHPSLIHGDLWSGNFLCDRAGEPVLIDPAVYYGDREAELAMMKLFGGFDTSCYEAYAQAWPLRAGHEQRIEIYQLYHLLNHLKFCLLLCFNPHFRGGKSFRKFIHYL